MVDVLNLDANYWLDCGGRSNADHARERPGRHLDNYGLWSCWLVDRYIPGASSRVVCDRAVRWLSDVDLGRDVATFSLSVFSALASQRLTLHGLPHGLSHLACAAAGSTLVDLELIRQAVEEARFHEELDYEAQKK